MPDIANPQRRTINIVLRQPFTQSSEVEANVVAQCVPEIERIDGHFAHLNFLGGARAQSNASFREDFEHSVGAPFTPQNFRKYRLSLLRNADAFINIRTGMSESTAFEIACNLLGDNPIPMFFAVWRNAPIKTTLTPRSVRSGRRDLRGIRQAARSAPPALDLSEACMRSRR